MTDRPRLTRKKAQQTLDTAHLVKAPDWPDSRQWHVVTDGGDVLVIVKPSYGGASRTGRQGWAYDLAVLGPSGNRDHWPTREQAAARGLAAWQRWATAPR